METRTGDTNVYALFDGEKVTEEELAWLEQVDDEMIVLHKKIRRLLFVDEPGDKDEFYVKLIPRQR